ncbi:MAG: amino acid adenylation domain-containing protein [Cyanobacteria bacterium P01_H01_bin.21]
MDKKHSTRKAQLSAAKQALLAKRLKGKSRRQLPTIPQRDPAVPVPLSFSQQRLWFLYQFEPENPFYNVPFALRLRGKLDILALDRAFQTLVQRHEILRTTIDDATGDPQQVIHSQGTVTLNHIDISSTPADSLWSQVKQLAHQEAGQPFDLRQGPFLRITLLTLAADEFVLLVTLHHIISDVWSTTILVQEIATLYHAYTQANPNPLPPLSIQYADFTLWQRQVLQGEYLQTQLKYWQQQFATPPPVLQLPTDRPRPAVQSFRGSHRSCTLSAALTTSLKALGQEANATLFMTLLAAFKLLLCRYSGQTDITVGSPIANRNQAAIEGLMGLFLNTLALRTELGENPSFRELLGRVREVALGAYAHQDLPFEKLVELLNLPRNLSHTPLFQVMFILQNPPNRAFDLSGLTFEVLEPLTETAKFDLTLVTMEVNGCLECGLGYNTDLFDPVTMDRLLGHFQTLLEAIVAAPDTPIHQLSFLTPVEWTQLYQWNQTQGQYATDSCLHQLFEAQVEKTPEAVAVTYGANYLTYGELNHRVDGLARCLQSMGVGPETLVGICLERSLEMVVALLAVLKAGGAYVPLDPGYPQQRLAFMVEDAQLNILLSQSHLSHLLPNYGGQRLYLDQPLPTPATGASLPLPLIQSENLAYMIYTSGSTGKPKGVQISHRGVVNSLQAQAERLEMTHKDSLLAVASICFDISVLDIFLPLIVGAHVTIASREVALDGFRLAEQLKTTQPTFLQATPATWRMLLLANWAGSKELTVLCGAEPLPPDLADALLSRCGALWNLYGPTETTIWSTQQQIKQIDAIAVGTPLSNIKVYLLDEHLNPVPVGVPGEVYIGGQGLARGYHHSPGLTAERFIPHPFGQTSGERLYKTGDLARQLPDGTLEVLGRLDHQVKIRGFRIELGEVESVLSRHEQVQNVVAMVREDSPGQKRLVTYLTAQDSPNHSRPTVGELRQWLKTQLPDYMIPAAFVWLEQIPLTPSGKTDRRALPEPDPEFTSTDRLFEAPRSPVEQTLAGIWSQVLGCSTIGIDDNFFELGGDSILSLQVVAQAHQEGLKLTSKHLFQHQTIRTLATVVEPVRTRVADQSAVVGAVPLSPIQHWFFSQPLVAPHDWNQSVLLELHQSLTLEDVQTIFRSLLVHHDGLRSTFQKQGTTWRQTSMAPEELEETLPCQLIDVPSLSESEQTQIITKTATALQASLDLTKGPLIRVVLFNFEGPKAHQRLLLMVHRLVIDTTSWQILLTDFQSLFHQRLQGKPLTLPPKTSSCQQWTQRLQADADNLPSENYQRLPSQLPLPVDFPKGENTVALSHTVTVSLDLGETESLLQQVPSVYHTHINDVLLTALVQTYTDWTGHSRLLIDLESQGREPIFEDIDISRTVGWFASLAPVLLDLTGVSHLGTSLKTVKEQLRQASHQGLEFGVYRYMRSKPELKDDIPQDLWLSPEICFSYLGQSEQRFETNDLVTLVTDMPRPKQGGHNPRSHVLAVEAEIVAGQLQISWTYSSAQYRPATIESLAEAFLQNLRSLIIHCLSPGAGGYTPSDLPLAQLDQTTLDRLVESYPHLVDGYSLSPLQQGILFHTLYSPEESLYVNQFCFHLKGTLNVEILKQTWQRVSQRHPILRTVFVWQDLPQPLQVVLRQSNISWHIADWRSHSAKTQTEKLTKLLQRDREAGFQLSETSPIRLTLIQLADDRHEVIWSFHHILIDGWSLQLLFRDVFTFYEGFYQGQPPQLSAPRPYRDYVAWLSTQDSTKAAAFWTPLLQGFQKTTPLKYDKVPHLAPDHKIQTLSLGDAGTAALQNLAQSAHLTLNTLVQAAWALLLSYISGEQDIVFGATTAGRPHDLAGADTIVGVFINSLPVRVQLLPDVSIITWLQDLQTQQSKAREYDYVPLSQIQRWSEIPAGKSLFESLVVFENYPIDQALDSIQVNLEIQSVQSFINNNYPITIRALPRDELVLQIMADRSCFAGEVTERWLQHLVALLQWLVAHPTASLGDWKDHLTMLDRQWQQQQAQTLTQTSRKKLRQARRKTVRPSHQESMS